MTAAILKVEDLSVAFQVDGGSKPILNNIGFELFPRQTLGIVGESGSGKSVTALSILKLIGPSVLAKMQGRILFEGRDLMPLTNRQMQTIRGKKIGLIFQEPMTALNPVLSIGEQITEMIRQHEKGGRQDARKRAVALLEEVGIPGPKLRMKSYPHQLSGGMRQRVMIAMALSCNPKLLIADEPTTALDVTVQAQILAMLQHLKTKRDLAIIFISHDLRVIAEIADKVLVMQKGCVVEAGAVEKIFRAPIHSHTRELLTLIPRRGAKGDHGAP
jgi:ABC-type dipeptide/oligopeptide/nickel transport system ATPase component